MVNWKVGLMERKEYKEKKETSKVSHKTGKLFCYW